MTKPTLPDQPLDANLYVLYRCVVDIARNYEFVRSITAAYTATNLDTFVLANAASAAFAITLPACSNFHEGKKFIVRKTDATANAVSFTSASTITNNVNLTTQWQTRTFISDGASWHSF